MRNDTRTNEIIQEHRSSYELFLDPDVSLENKAEILRRVCSFVYGAQDVKDALIRADLVHRQHRA